VCFCNQQVFVTSQQVTTSLQNYEIIGGQFAIITLSIYIESEVWLNKKNRPTLKINKSFHKTERKYFA